MRTDAAGDELIQYLDEDEAGHMAADAPVWRVAVIDDEPAVFEATELALRGLKFDGRKIQLLQARSAAAGKALLAETPDIACVLLDVVMESEHAGLDLVRAIREELANGAVRIVLRTGQPGYAPPLDVLQRYDINDYKEKTELTQTALWTSIVCALRSYEQIRLLDRGRKGLRTVIDASARMMRRHGLPDFYRSALAELTAHLDPPADGLLCIRPTGSGTGRFVAASGAFQDRLDHPIDQFDDAPAREAIELSLAQQSDRFSPRDAAFYIGGPAWDGVVYLAGHKPLDAVQRDLLRLLGQNIALGIENARLLDHVTDLAYVDRVTGLASRPRIEQTLKEMIGRGQAPSALVVNIDGFSNYTTGLGDSFGHALLRAFAARLLALPISADRVGCLYRDVFCLVLEDRAAAAALQQALDSSITIEDQRLRLGLSFGLSAGFEPGMTAGDLVRQAEIAARSTKHRLRKGVPMYTPELEQAHRSRAFLAHDLREALERDEVSLAYQAQVDAVSQKVIGAEALMRWQHPERGSIPPAEFIDIAEASGLIGEVGKWVTRRACREMKPLVDAGLLGRVMINLSPVQLRDPDCLAELTAIVAEEGVPFSAVEWEITESATLGGGNVLAQLEAARAAGFTIALDDFGTGYSSLSMIRTLPLNVVKIDRSFLLEVATSQHAWSILFSIASICEDLGLAMVAEGVETTAQLKMVRAANIGTMQGYLVSRPLPFGEFNEWLTGLGR
jgi:predicted signal transduction protein with EAL and GGDEF domain